jgi:predicted AlkP superfamily pyrophosphatase or phosphodiesterase
MFSEQPSWFRMFRIALAMLAGVLQVSQASASTNHHVILVTIDGLAAYYLFDPQAPLPTLRKLAAEGASAEALRVSNPTTTWPNHTTLITGVSPARHSVLFNGLLVRQGPGQPVRIEGDHDQHELISVPTLYDRLHGLGYRTAGVNWPCTRGASTLDDNWPDAPDGIRSITPRLRAELVRDKILHDGNDSGNLITNALGHDQAWCAAAIHILQKRPPNLLLLHLLATDILQHRNGPKSPAAYAALAEADARIADVVRALAEAGILQNSTLFVASDHGFERPSYLVSPNVVLRKSGLLRPAPRRRAQSVSEGGTAFVYLTNPGTAGEDRAKVIALLREVQGIDRILEPRQYAELRLPDPTGNSQMGDLLLVGKEGYTFSDEVFDDDIITPIPISLGSHGYLATDPRMNGVLVVWGRGIKAGTKLGAVDNLDVAPTIGALLGIELPDIEGRVLREILIEPNPH